MCSTIKKEVIDLSILTQKKLDSVDYVMENNANFASTILFLRRSRFLILDHSIDEEEFTAKIYYNKELLVRLIIQFVDQMIQEIKQNKKLNDSGWVNTVVFVNETGCFSAYFESCVFLTVKTC